MKLDKSSIRRAELDVLADVRLSGPAGDVVVRSGDRRIVAVAEGSRPALDLLRSGAGPAALRRSALRAHAALEAVGLTLEIRSGPRFLARLGRDSRPGALARWLGVPGIEIGWYGTGLALWSVVRPTARGGRTS